MKKEYSYALAGLLLGAITFSVVQWVMAAAPNPGHAWTTIECDTNFCVGTGKAGVASSTPSDTMSVQGNIISSGKITVYGTSVTSTFQGDVSAPNNTLTGCTWSTYHCNTSDTCAQGKVVAGVGRETGGAPGCGSAPNQFYKLRVLCCGI